MTGTNRNFFTKNIFISGERYEDYILIFFTIRKLYNIYKLRYPSTFVINTYPAEIAAIKRVFLDINYILCIWHVNCNILTKFKSLIKTQFNRENNKNINNKTNSQIIF